MAAAVMMSAVMAPAASRSAESRAVRLPNIFRSNMVIERGKPITVWGWAEPGRKVAV